jgi:hypothetical protein
VVWNIGFEGGDPYALSNKSCTQDRFGPGNRSGRKDFARSQASCPNAYNVGKEGRAPFLPRAVGRPGGASNSGLFVLDGRFEAFGPLDFSIFCETYLEAELSMLFSTPWR